MDLISSHDHSFSSNFLRGVNAQGVMAWNTWFFLGQPLSEWKYAQYRARLPLISNEPTGWHGSVLQALQFPFHWESHKKKTWPEEDVYRWLKAMNFTQDILKENCEMLPLQHIIKLSLIRALSLKPSIMLIDDIWGLFTLQDQKCITNTLLSWLHSDDDQQRAIVSIDHSLAVKQSTHRYTLDANGLTLQQASVYNH